MKKNLKERLAGLSPDDRKKLYEEVEQQADNPFSSRITALEADNAKLRKEKEEGYDPFDFLGEDEEEEK